MLIADCEHNGSGLT